MSYSREDYYDDEEDELEQMLIYFTFFSSM